MGSCLIFSTDYPRHVFSMALLVLLMTYLKASCSIFDLNPFLVAKEPSATLTIYKKLVLISIINALYIHTCTGSFAIRPVI